MALNLSTLTSPATSGDVLAEALTTADFLEPVPVLRNLARGSQKGGDAKQTVSTQQPKALPLIDGDGYLYCSGVANNYAAIADESALDVSGDLTLEADLTLADWTPSAIQRVLTKYNTGGTNNRSYQLYIDVDGNLGFVISSDGSYQLGNHEESTVSLPSQGIVDGQRVTIRAEWRASDGRLQFFYKTNGGNFTQLGTDQSAPAGSIHNSSEPVIIGASNGGASSMVTGAIHSAKIYASINDTNKVLDVDFTATNVRHGDTKFKCATGQVVTINKSGNDPATIIKKPVLRFITAVGSSLRGQLNRTITDGGYYFAAFTINGDGGNTASRVFAINSTGQNETANTGFVYAIKKGATNDLASYHIADYTLPHDDLYDDARGDILHQVKTLNNAQLSAVNGAAAITSSVSTSNLSAEEFGICCENNNSQSSNPSLDLEYLALFPATITDAQADDVRNYINNRNTVFLRHDTDGYYFYDAQKAPAVPITSGSASWNGRIVGSDNGDTDRYLTQGTSNDAPVGDGYVVTFADNTDHLEIPQVTQAGWQVVGTSLGTFAYRVNANAVTELNLLGNANTGATAYRQTGDLYGIILLPESATGSDIEAARKLLIDRGAADGVTASSVENYFRERDDMVEFKGVSFSDVTSFTAMFFGSASLTTFNVNSLPDATNISYAFRGSGLTSFNTQLPLVTNANNAFHSTNITSFDVELPEVTRIDYAFKGCSSLTSFSSELPSATTLSNAWYYCSSLSDFRTTDIKNGTNFTSAWNGCSALSSFPAGAKLGTEANNVDFNNAWRSSGLTSFSTPLPTATNVYLAWYNCQSLTSFDAPLPSTKNVRQAWQSCISLTDFSAGVFDNWNPPSIQSSVFTSAWDNCTSLTAQSVENILTSIDASGKYATSTGASGGTALADAGIDIDYDGTTLSAATNSAVTSLKAKGWSIIVNNVTL